MSKPLKTFRDLRLDTLKSEAKLPSLGAPDASAKARMDMYDAQPAASRQAQWEPQTISRAGFVGLSLRVELDNPAMRAQAIAIVLSNLANKLGVGVVVKVGQVNMRAELGQSSEMVLTNYVRDIKSQR